MSLVDRQKTCAVCGRPFEKDDSLNIEPLVDKNIRYITVHLGESTFPSRQSKEESSNGQRSEGILNQQQSEYSEENPCDQCTEERSSDAANHD
jgi:hypothetical protein